MSENNQVATRQEAIARAAADLPTVSPQVDIFENEDEILLMADMPGVEKSQISVNIDNGKLQLSGVRNLKNSGATVWEEFGEVEYQRTFSVPQSIAVDKVSAELKEGVLHLRLPKAESAKVKQITIS